MTKNDPSGGSAEENDEYDESGKKRLKSLLEWFSKEHVAYKAFNFFFYGANQTFNSYVSVYLKSLGLTAAQVGLINGTHPLFQIIGAPLAGVLGDKYKIKKKLLLLGLVFMTIRTMLYLPFQPRKQTCQITNATQNNSVSTTRIRYRIVKRLSLFNHRYRSDFMTEEDAPWIEPALPNGNNISINDRDDILFLKQRSSSNEQFKKAMDPYEPSINTTTIVKEIGGHKLIFKKLEDKDEMRRIFIILLCLTMFGEIFEAFASTIADTCCLDYLGEAREMFGVFRFWGALGASISSSLCGIVFDHFAVEICGQRVNAYHFVFFFYFGYMCTAILTTAHFCYRYHDDSNTATPLITKNILRSTFWNLRYGTFLLASLYMGLCYGFLTSFSFWFLDDLGASATLLGIASALRSISENCVYLFSPFVLRRFGHVIVASGCLLVFALTFLSYSFVKDPWVAIPLEISYTAAYAFAWTTCVSYMNNVAPRGSTTMIQGVVQASFWGLGFGSGSIIGGISFESFGNRRTFTGFAITSSAMFFLFIVVQLILVFIDCRAKNSFYTRLQSTENENKNNVEK